MKRLLQHGSVQGSKKQGGGRREEGSIKVKVISQKEPKDGAMLNMLLVVLMKPEAVSEVGNNAGAAKERPGIVNGS